MVLLAQLARTTLKGAPPPAEAAALTVAQVDAALTTIGAAAEKGSAPERKRLVDELFGRATADEQYFLVRLLFGELRQGALPGVMADAVAKAAGVPVADVRRAAARRSRRSGCRSDSR